MAGGDPSGLVLAVLADEPGAWDALVQRFAGLVWAIARGHGLGRADAADVSQTTWLRLAEHVDDVRDPERIGGWLATTARRESLRMLRMAQRQIPVDPSSSLPSEERMQDVDETLLKNERDAELWRAVESLPPRCKVLVRALVADPPPSYADISAALDIPIGSIGPNRQRCLDRLRKQASPEWRQDAESGTNGHGGATKEKAGTA